MAPSGRVSAGVLIMVLAACTALRASAGGLYSPAQVSAIKAAQAKLTYDGGGSADWLIAHGSVCTGCIGAC